MALGVYKGRALVDCLGKDVALGFGCSRGQGSSVYKSQLCLFDSGKRGQGQSAHILGPSVWASPWTWAAWLLEVYGVLELGFCRSSEVSVDLQVTAVPPHTS